MGDVADVADSWEERLKDVETADPAVQEHVKELHTRLAVLTALRDGLNEDIAVVNAELDRVVRIPAWIRKAAVALSEWDGNMDSDGSECALSVEELEARLRAGLESVPQMEHTSETMKERDPAWQVETLSYRWAGKDVVFETMYQWTDEAVEVTLTESPLGARDLINFEGHWCRRGLVKTHYDLDLEEFEMADIGDIDPLFLPILAAYAQGDLTAYR